MMHHHQCLIVCVLGVVLLSVCFGTQVYIKEIINSNS